MTQRWGIVGGTLALLALAGCDVSVGKCDRNDAGSCFDDFPEWDAGGGIDSGSAPASDGAVIADAASDAAIIADSGSIDGSLPDAAPPVALTIEQFCDAQYRTAKQWRDKLEECCVSNSELERDLREVLLNNSFFYSVDDTTGEDSVERCIDSFKATPSANLTFVGTAASSCSARYTAQFPAAPATCPADGFATETIESMVGHGAASLIQLPECRTAFVGKVAFNAACTNSFECQTGLRCLGSSGAKTCRAPFSRGNPCSVTSECEDGLVCMGLASGNAGRVCYPANELLESGSTCDATETSATGGSTECRTGLICFENKCVTPQTSAICRI
jgi:hypothetical protein